MEKSRDAFRTISEVATWLGTPAHVLRFWETKFSQVKPVKRAGGRRYYRPVDMMLLGGIKRLLHDDGMTIKGVQKILRERGVRHVASLSPIEVEGVVFDTPAPEASPPSDSLFDAAELPVATAPVADTDEQAATSNDVAPAGVPEDEAPNVPDPVMDLGDIEPVDEEAERSAVAATEQAADVSHDPTSHDAPAQDEDVSADSEGATGPAQKQAEHPAPQETQPSHSGVLARLADVDHLDPTQARIIAKTQLPELRALHQKLRATSAA